MVRVCVCVGVCVCVRLVHCFVGIIIEDPIISSLFAHVSWTPTQNNVFNPPVMPVQEQHGRPDFPPRH